MRGSLHCGGKCPASGRDDASLWRVRVRYCFRKPPQPASLEASSITSAARSSPFASRIATCRRIRCGVTRFVQDGANRFAQPLSAELLLWDHDSRPHMRNPRRHSRLIVPHRDRHQRYALRQRFQGRVQPRMCHDDRGSPHQLQLRSSNAPRSDSRATLPTHSARGCLPSRAPDCTSIPAHASAIVRNIPSDPFCSVPSEAYTSGFPFSRSQGNATGSRTRSSTNGPA